MEKANDISKCFIYILCFVNFKVKAKTHKT